MRQIVKGSTTISVDVYIIDSTDGTPETGVVFNTSGIDLEYRRDGEVAVNITEADLATPALTDAWADGGFLAIGHGLYRLDVPDAAFATGAGESTVSIQGTVTGMIVLPQTIQLIEGFVVAGTDGVPDVNLTHIIDGAVPAQNVTGVLEVDVTHFVGEVAPAPAATGVPDVNVTHWIDGAVPSQGITGVPEVDLTHIVAGLVPTPATTGIPDVNVREWLDTAAATPTVAGVPEVDVTHQGGGAIPAPAVTGVPDVNPTHWIDGAIPAQGITGVPEVDLTHINAAAQTATLDNIEAQTDDIGVAGAGLTDLGGMSTGMKAEVQAEVVDALKEMGLVLSSSTIETVTNQTNFIIPVTDDAVDDDAYNDLTAVFIDGTDANQVSVRSVINYTASTRSIQVDKAPDFTVTTSDKIILLSTSNARAIWNRVITGAEHNVTNSTGRILRQIQERGSYSGGFVYIDTVNGTAGTTDFENGTDSNAVNSIADANTIAASRGLSKFDIAPGSSITFAAAQENQTFVGRNWTLALGGQSISNSHITGADVSGTGTSSTEAHFDHCEMGDCILGTCHIDESDLEGDLTLSAAANYFILGCYHTSTTSPIVDFGAAVANQVVHIHDYHGALTVKNMGQGTDTLHFSSPDGKLTLDSTNTGGTKNLNGTFELADSSTGQTTNKAGLIIDLVPTALVGGRMDSSVGAMAANVLTASAIAANAITAAKIATDAITAAKIAADAIGSSELATSAVNEIRDAIVDLQIADSVPADGTLPTIQQALYMTLQIASEFGIVGTTMTVRKVDGTTALMTFTLDDGTNPTDLTRAT